MILVLNLNELIERQVVPSYQKGSGHGEKFVNRTRIQTNKTRVEPKETECMKTEVQKVKSETKEKTYQRASNVQYTKKANTH